MLQLSDAAELAEWVKFNPYHDEQGRFSSGAEGAGEGLTEVKSLSDWLKQESPPSILDDKEFWQSFRLEILRTVTPIFQDLLFAGVEQGLASLPQSKKKEFAEKFNPHHDEHGRFASAGGGSGSEGAPVSASDIKTQADLKSFATLPTGTDVYTHATRYREYLENIAKNGIDPSRAATAGGTIWASKSPLVRDLGGGFVVFKSSTMKDSGMDRVPGGPSYHQYTTKTKILPSSFLRVVRNYQYNVGGHGINETDLAKYALKHQGLRDADVLALPKKYQKWFNLPEGTKELGQKITGVDEDILTQRVLEFFAKYTNEWYDAFELTTRNQLRAVLEQGVQEGLAYRDIAKKLEPIFSKKRAMLITQTEMTRLMNAGADLVYQEAQVQRVKYKTVRDAYVCDICEAVADEVFPLDSKPELPQHPRCRCFYSPVVEEEKSLGEKFNPHHDARGRFASAGGGSSGRPEAEIGSEWVHSTTEEDARAILKDGVDVEKGHDGVFWTARESIAYGGADVTVRLATDKVIRADDPRIRTEGGRRDTFMFNKARALGYQAIYDRYANQTGKFDWLIVLDSKAVQVKGAKNRWTGEQIKTRKVKMIWWEDYLKLPASQKSLQDWLSGEKFNPYHDAEGRFASGGGGLSLEGEGADGQLTASQIQEASSKLQVGDTVIIKFQNGREILDPLAKYRVASASGSGTGEFKWSQPQKMQGKVKSISPRHLEIFNSSRGTFGTLVNTQSRSQRVLSVEKATS